MENVIKLYEEHKERLMSQYKEIMNLVAENSGKTEDKEMRNYIGDLTSLASYVSSCISSTEYAIKKLKRKMVEKQIEEA